ncbi:hypothetical protein EAF00_011036 [Botryotinia globosa]|nr:hypothetical protein EAF00_011036 [Botryotinia globosa]
MVLSAVSLVKASQAMSVQVPSGINAIPNTGSNPSTTLSLMWKNTSMVTSGLSTGYTQSSKMSSAWFSNKTASQKTNIRLNSSQGSSTMLSLSDLTLSTGGYFSDFSFTTTQPGGFITIIRAITLVISTPYPSLISLCTATDGIGKIWCSVSITPKPTATFTFPIFKGGYTPSSTENIASIFTAPAFYIPNITNLRAFPTIMIKNPDPNGDDDIEIPFGTPTTKFTVSSKCSASAISSCIASCTVSDGSTQSCSTICSTTTACSGKATNSSTDTSEISIGIPTWDIHPIPSDFSDIQASIQSELAEIFAAAPTSPD